MLFVPAVNERALEKARGLPCDALIIDCEDGVAPARKAEAREAAVGAVESGGYGARRVAVRVNGLGTEWFPDDVRAVVEAGAADVVVPKVGSAAEAHAAAHAVDAAGAAPHVAIWAMIETPAGVLDAAAIAASPRVRALVVGTNDLASELRAARVPGRAPLLHALGACVMAARAAGVDVLDGVFNDTGDPEGLACECRQAAAMGFDGKTLIHPGQIAAANAAFSPSDDDVARARRIVDAFAAHPDAGVLTVDGAMAEELHLREARRVLARARAGGPQP